MNGKIFVSYHLKDQKAGEWITTFLRVQSVPFTGLEEEYDQCDTFAALISYHYLRSPDLLSLLQLAVSERKRLVFVMINEELAARYGGNFLDWLANIAYPIGSRYRKVFQSIMREVDLANIPCLLTDFEQLRFSAAYSRWQSGKKEGLPLWLMMLEWLMKSPPGWDVSGEKNSDCRLLYEFLTNPRQLPAGGGAEALPAPAEEVSEDVPEAEPVSETGIGETESKAVPEPDFRVRRRIPSLIRENSGEIIELPEGIFYIGSDPLRCGYCLEMPDILDRHAAFRTGEHASYITEAVSGTLTVNGQSDLPKDFLLRHGDIITLGEESFIFRYL